MYDFYPDDWGGPEPFEPLVEDDSEPIMTKGGCDCPENGVCPCPCHDMQLADQTHDAPAVNLPVLTEDEIRAFLVRVATNERYPEETRRSAHTLLQRRTPSVKALSHRETLQEIRDDPETSPKTRIKAGHLIVRRGAVRTEDLRGL